MKRKSGGAKKYIDELKEKGKEHAKVRMAVEKEPFNVLHVVGDDGRMVEIKERGGTVFE